MMNSIALTLLLAIAAAGQESASSHLPVQPSAPVATFPQIELSPAEQLWLSQNPVIHYGIDPAWPPLEFLDSGLHRGLTADYLDLIGRRLGIRFELVESADWSETMALAERKRIDLFPCVGITEERKAYLDFTRPYLSFPLIIVTRRDETEIRSIEDLYGRGVAVARGYYTHEIMRRDHPRVGLVLTNSEAEALKAVSTGVADAFIGNLAVASYLIERDGLVNLKIAAPTDYANSELAFGVRKDLPELTAILQKALDSITESERREILRRWISVRYEQSGDASLLRRIALTTLVATGFVVSVVLLWNWSLQRQIAERRRAQEELARKSSILESTMENITQGILMADADGRIVAHNSRYRTLFGFSEEFMAEHTRVEDILEEWVRMSGLDAAALEEARQALKRREPFVYELKHPNGKTIEVIHNPAPDGSLVRTYADITERTRVAEERQAAMQAAEAANRAKSAFLANMSHEIRTPMNAILGFTQLLQRTAHLDAQQREYLELISRSGEHLLALINDVLDMSKIEAGRVTLNPTCFDLHALLSDLDSMFRLRASAKQLRLGVELSPKVPHYVRADEGKFRQILVNLLGNAVKFTDEGGVSLRVDGTPSDDGRLCLVIEVEDTGPGIPEAEMTQLFQAFQQTSAGAFAKGGTGLGLAISRQFTRLMGGDIQVTSRVGEGTLFTVRVPVERAEASEISAPTTRRRVTRLQPGTPPPRLLVVDDKDENAYPLMQLLTTVGCEVQVAENGEKAVELWESWRPHLIWMDIRMPGMDGYEATRAIRSKPGSETTIIIALTASAFEDERASVLAAGCNDFVRKPFRDSVIFDKLAEHLGVTYAYDDQVDAVVPDGSQSATALPASLIDALRGAVLAADITLVSRLIDETAELDPFFASRLRSLAHEYAYDRMTSLLNGGGSP